MDYFVSKNSIVRKIWGHGDTVLFIFAGAAAEFSLNKAVDWLYFTGKLPADPLGRLFSTVGYARQIVFSKKEVAYQTIDKMRAIHAGVEKKRGAIIPDWAYRDVLFMLIDYSIRSFELLERKLTPPEKAEVFDVFFRVGHRMGIPGLPQTLAAWEEMRKEHLNQNLEKSEYTIHLYQQYHQHLGSVRYYVLRQSQIMVVPDKVKQLLQLSNRSVLRQVLPVYKLSRSVKLDWLIKALLLPPAYKAEIKSLDSEPV